MPRLWRYNLHYFDTLVHDSRTPKSAQLALMTRWVAENPMPYGAGWEPYPLSRRIVNWIKFSLLNDGLPPELDQSLATQVRALATQLEYHLLGNHLFANAVALSFAGHYFAGSEADCWRARGVRICTAELSEQILDDGAHFERSPMYHASMLQDILDIANLHQTYGTDAPPALADVVPKMFHWLAAMTHSNGKLAHFNDTVDGVAPSLATLRTYARKLGIGRLPAAQADLIDLSASGYYRLNTPRQTAFFDAAPVAAPYLLGHGHADALSFEYDLDGGAVIVNSGISSYDDGARRTHERGTKSKSTITIDNENSSEIWGAFRCGRHARITQRRSHASSTSIWAQARHDGYRARGGGAVHHTRNITLTDAGLQVLDEIDAPHLQRDATVTMRFLLAPGIKVQKLENSLFAVQRQHSTLLLFEGDPALNWHVGTDQYAVSFNHCIPIQTLVGEAQIAGSAGYICHFKIPQRSS